MTASPEPKPAQNPKPDFPWIHSYPVDIDWQAPLSPSTMGDMFDAAVKKYKDRPCLNFMGNKMTYGELGAAVDKFAKSLQDQGFGKGSRVGLCLPNTPYYVIAYFGALKAGATVVNFNPLYAEKELESQINDSQTDIMVTVNVKHVLPKVEKMLGRTGLKKIVCCDFGAALPTVKKYGFRVIDSVKKIFGKNLLVKAPHDAKHLSFDDMLNSTGAPKPAGVTPDDIAVLQYTGGTTGIPKAAALSHSNLTCNLQQAHLWFTGGKTLPAGEKMLAVLPFFHVFSMTVQMNMSINSGIELIMLPKFDVKDTLKTIDREKPTMFAGVPTLYKALVDCPDVKKYDLSSLKICLSGGSALNENVMRGFKALTGIDLTEGYGLSETAPIATANPVFGKKKLNSIGMPVPQTEVKIANMELPDQRQPIKVEGEICIKGPQVMKGYWNRPDETAKVMDKDGFFRTGDIGYVDEHGYIFIVDRIKDMINASGLKVFPRKVEEALLQHPQVSEASVIGVEDEYRGETVKAFIVLRQGQKLDEKEMLAFLKDKLAPYEMPKVMETRGALPKTMIGKPDKKALVAEEKAKAAQRKKGTAPKGPKI